MTSLRPIALLSLLGALAPAYGADPEVRVIIWSDIQPGVYGRVELGNAPPPPLVYTKPRVVIKHRPPAPPPKAIYLHVPPGHAKNWSKHCRKYDACGVPVYFVKSKEYDPKPKKEKKDRKD